MVKIAYPRTILMILVACLLILALGCFIILAKLSITKKATARNENKSIVIGLRLAT